MLRSHVLYSTSAARIRLNRLLCALQLKELLATKFKSLQDFSRYNAAKPAREEPSSHLNGATPSAASSLSAPTSSLKPSGIGATGGSAAAANGAGREWRSLEWRDCAAERRTCSRGAVTARRAGRAAACFVPQLEHGSLADSLSKSLLCMWPHQHGRCPASWRLCRYQRALRCVRRCCCVSTAVWALIAALQPVSCALAGTA